MIKSSAESRCTDWRFTFLKVQVELGLHPMLHSSQLLGPTAWITALLPTEARYLAHLFLLNLIAIGQLEPSFNLSIFVFLTFKVALSTLLLNFAVVSCSVDVDKDAQSECLNIAFLLLDGIDDLESKFRTLVSSWWTFGKDGSRKFFKMAEEQGKGAQ